jgi:hypothetical protein
MLILEGIGNLWFFWWGLDFGGKIGGAWGFDGEVVEKMSKGELLFVFIFIFGCQLQMH